MEEKKIGILFKIIFILIVPLSLFLFMVIQTMLSPRMYAGILKKAELVTVFIEHKDKEVKNEIDRELNNNPKLKALYVSLEKKEKKYLEEKKRYEKLAETEVNNDLINKINSVKEWDYGALQKLYSSKKDFRVKKKSELARLEAQLKELNSRLDFKEEMIIASEERLDKSEEEYLDAKEIIKEANALVLDKIEDKQGSFVGKMYQDLNILGPVLNRELNNKLIDTVIKEELEKILDFLKNYNREKKAGNVFYKLKKETSGDGDTITELNIRFPKFKVNMMIDVVELERTRKRHFFAEYLPDVIRDIKDPLHHKNKYIVLFKAFDNKLVEGIARSHLKGMNMSIKNGVLYISSATLGGENALLLEQVMKQAAFLGKIKYAFILIVVLMVVLLLMKSGGIKTFMKNFSSMLYVPSLLFLVLGLMLVLFSGLSVEYLSGDYNNTLVGSYLNQGAYSVMYNLLFPTWLVYLGVFSVCSIVRKSNKKVKEENSEGIKLS
jgi:hypothetical protein